jgi:hypothetical protein
MMGEHEKYSRWMEEELKELERWDWERLQSYTFKAKARALGVSVDTLERAVWRARLMFRSQRTSGEVKAAV